MTVNEKQKINENFNPIIQRRIHKANGNIDVDNTYSDFILALTYPTLGNYVFFLSSITFGIQAPITYSNGMKGTKVITKISTKYDEKKTFQNLII